MKNNEGLKPSVEVSISGSTRLLALLGDPVTHSISPAMHNKAFQILGLNYAYMGFTANKNNLKSSVDAMKALNVLGFNVTMPIKQKILPYLDELSFEAEMIGAVNTVKNENGKLIGYNTDGPGYVMDLQDKGLKIRKQSFLIVGAGGAATSIAVALARAGAGQITVINRSIEKAEHIISLINKISPDCMAFASKFEDDSIAQELVKANVLINCTPLGMGHQEGISFIQDPSILHKDMIISDLIYVPRKTALLKLGDERGCKTINGIGMIIWQGALAFKIWTGEDMPIQDIKQQLF